MSMPDDSELVAQAKKGSATSFEEIVRRYQVRLLHFLRKWNNVADAEDLLQETFLRAWRKLDQYEDRWAFSTWLFTIARRLSYQADRRQRPEPVDPASGILDREIAMPPTPGDDSLWQLARRELTEPQWTAVWLYYVEDMPIKEIACVVEKSDSSVKVLLFRARKKLAQAIQTDRARTQGDLLQ